MKPKQHKQKQINAQNKNKKHGFCYQGFDGNALGDQMGLQAWRHGESRLRQDPTHERPTQGHSTSQVAQNNRPLEPQGSQELLSLGHPLKAGQTGLRPVLVYSQQKLGLRSPRLSRYSLASGGPKKSAASPFSHIGIKSLPKGSLHRLIGTIGGYYGPTRDYWGRRPYWSG